MPSTIFGTEIPAQVNITDGVPYSLGTRFVPSVDGTATHAKWYFPLTIPSPTIQVKAGIYRNSDQALLGQVSFPLGATLQAWNQVAFGAPVPLLAGIEYTAVVWTPDRFVLTTLYPWPVGAGDVVSIATGAGRFTQSADIAFPTTNVNSSYFPDIVFEPGGAPANPFVTPNGIGVPVALGSPSLAMRVTPSGLSVPVSMGGVSVAGPPYVPEQQSSGWSGLLRTLRDNRPDGEPVACPNDGEPLRRSVSGQLYCPYDGYRVR